MEFSIRELMNLSHQRFIANLNKVIEKYEACCDDLDDEVDLTTLEIVTDNGVLRKMKKATLSCTTSSVLFACFDKIPQKKNNRSTKKKKKRRKINAVEEINEENSNNVDPPVIDDHIVNAENQQLEELSTSMLPEVHKLKISEIVNKEACFNYLKNNCKLRMKYMPTYKPRKSTVDDIFLYINAGKGAFEFKINRSVEPFIANNNIRSCFGTKKSPSINRNSDISSKNRSLTLKNIVKSKDQNSSQLSKQSAILENDDSNDTYIENCSFSKSEEKLTKQNKIANYQKPDLLSLNEDLCNQYKEKGLSSHTVSDKNDTCFEGKINGEFKTPHSSPRQKCKHHLRDSFGRFIKSPEKIICGDFNEVKVSVESVIVNNIRSSSGSKKSPSMKSKSDISSKNKSPTVKNISDIKEKNSSPLFKQRTNVENDDSNHTYLENCSFSENEGKSTKQNQIAKYQKPALLSLSEDPCNQYKAKELTALSLSDKNEICFEEKINKNKTQRLSFKNKHKFLKRDSFGRFIKLSEQTISDNFNEVKVLAECSSLKPDEINSNKKYPITKECHVVLTNPVFQSPVKRKKLSLLSELKRSTEYNETNNTNLENCPSLNNKHKLEKRMTVADFNISPSLSMSKADSKDKYQKKLSIAPKEMTKQVVSRNSEKRFSALQNEVFWDNKVSPNTCSKYDISNVKKTDNKHKLEKQMTVADFNISPSLSPSGATSKDKHLKKLSNSCKITTKQVVPRNLEKSFSVLQNEIFCDHKASPKKASPKASPHRSRYNAPNAKAKFDKTLHNKIFPHLKNVPLDDLTIFD